MRLGLAAAALSLAACGTIGLPTSNPPAASPTPPRRPTPTDFVVCNLVPLADVQAKSPFQTALATSESGATSAMCEYRSAEDAEEPVSVLLEVAEFGSAADALTSLADARQAAVDLGLPVSDIHGLGDSAFSSGSDEVEVRAASGPFVIAATMKGEWPDTTDDAKVSAGKQLVRTIISRLP